MKSRILSWLLVLVMCASLLSACDANAGQSSDESNTPTQSEIVSSDGNSTDQQEAPDVSGDPSDDADSTQSGTEESDVPQNSDVGSEPVPPLTPEPEEPSPPAEQAPATIVDASGFSLSSVGAYSGKAYVSVNGNTPYFTADELSSTSFELYSDLDALGRCGTVYASIGKDLMPTEERGSIGMVKPTGWHTVRYDDLVDGKYLYNRCHLIGFQLTGENANTSNLITGTRYLNIEGTHTRPEDYDGIFTGDLGMVGSQLLYQCLDANGVDLRPVHQDCGLLLYDRERQDVHAGGSGCGCSAGVLCGHLLRRMGKGELKNILFCATGALMSPTSQQQGLAIPGVCHVVQLTAG